MMFAQSPGSQVPHPQPKVGTPCYVDASSNCWKVTGCSFVSRPTLSWYAHPRYLHLCFAGFLVKPTLKPTYCRGVVAVPGYHRFLKQGDTSPTRTSHGTIPHPSRNIYLYNLIISYIYIYIYAEFLEFESGASDCRYSFENRKGHLLPLRLD